MKLPVGRVDSWLESTHVKSSQDISLGGSWIEFDMVFGSKFKSCVEFELSGSESCVESPKSDGRFSISVSYIDIIIS